MEMGSPFTAGRIPVIIRGEKTILGKGVLYMADRCRIRTEFPRPEEAREAAARAAALGRRDEKRLADILAGRGFPHPFVEEALEKLGVEYAEGE